MSTDRKADAPNGSAPADCEFQQSTQAVRAGLECDDHTGCVVPPIHLTSTFAFRGFGEKRAYDYTRSGNPTRDLLANALTELEEGAGGVVTSTGMSAITLVGYLIPAGARIVAPHDCYGGTYRLFNAWHQRGERQVEFVNFNDDAAVREALSRPCALLWIETPSNPLLRITDIEKISALGHAAGVAAGACGFDQVPGRHPAHRGAADPRAGQWRFTTVRDHCRRASLACRTARGAR